MMKHEFEALAGYEVTTEDYNNLLEPMYMAVNVTKQEFVKMIDKKRFALPTKGEIKKSMREIANEIFEGCGIRSYWREEDELLTIAREYARRFYGIEWASDMKSFVYPLYGYGYAGNRIDNSRANRFPDTIVIGRDGVEYERIVLIA